MIPQAVIQAPTAITQNQRQQANNVPMAPAGLNTNQLSPHDQFLLLNMPDEALAAWAKHDPVQQFNNSPTRTATSIVGNSIPFVDSYLQGALHKGSAGAKLAKSVSTGSDWGVFTGAIWLYNKALGKAYDTFPGMRKFKEDHPTTAFVGEVGSAVLVGRGAIKGWHIGFKKLSKGKSFEQVVEGWANKNTRITENLAKIFKPVSKFAEKHPVITKYTGIAMVVTVVGIIAKNIFDVHKVKKDSDKNLEHLKAQRTALAEKILNKV